MFSINLRFPKSLILVLFIFFKNNFVSLFWGKLIFILLNVDMAKFSIFIHLSNVFFVSLAFNNINGMLLFSKLLNILGQISDSINIAKRGLQIFKNLFVKYI